MKNFRTYDVAFELYKESQKIRIRNPAIRDQFERASLSVLNNLAEGSGKFTAKDRRKYYSIALGSLREMQCMLQILAAPSAMKSADQLGGMIYRLVQNPGGS